MEESRSVKSKRVSFSVTNSLNPYFMNERMDAVKAGSKSGESHKEKPLSWVVCNHTSEVHESTNQAMEFLCRSWSPSSSEFLNILSSQITAPNLDGENLEGNQVVKEPKAKSITQFNGDIRIIKNHTWTWLSSERYTASSIRRHKSQCNTWMSAKCMKALLSGELLKKKFRGTQMKSKEKLRLQIAQVHAAISVARLAASIAGTVSNVSLEPVKNWNMTMPNQGGGWDKNMSMVVASAAMLVATVCAEAAESVGAQRSLVASAINRGLATNSAAEIIGLTAAAATCLRGASTLQVRTAANRLLSEDRMILVRGTQLPNCSQTDRITRTLECKNNEGCAEDDHGLCSIALDTTEGTVQLLFEDKKQYLQWRSTISYLLSIRDETKLII